ncbi:hypothetical protein Glove_21g342 [Diversispora epigaea]|uniref:Uncharacterized protein n=1 Tax=Diversispora epigaea TaxID=1348612 RepID=A0A397JWA3_9GLOM|nr:hypothetical protein Glove_21g342 [Diversispora epigaea]
MGNNLSLVRNKKRTGNSKNAKIFNSETNDREKLLSLGEKLLEKLEMKPLAYSQNDLKKNPNMTNIKDVKPLPLGSWGGKLGEEFAESFLIALPYLAERSAKANNYPLEEINE